MAFITTETRRTGAVTGSALDLIARLWQRAQRARNRRRADAWLNAFTPEQLRDLGLDRRAVETALSRPGRL